MNTKDISEPFTNEDGYVKQNDNKSAFSLKNATIACLVGGAAVLGSYIVQPADKQASEKLVETLNAKDNEEI
jgi:GTP-sensing pleiotropic transcriptional regulator CodY